MLSHSTSHERERERKKSSGRRLPCSFSLSPSSLDSRCTTSVSLFLADSLTLLPSLLQVLRWELASGVSHGGLPSDCLSFAASRVPLANLFSTGKSFWIRETRLQLREKSAVERTLAHNRKQDRQHDADCASRKEMNATLDGDVRRQQLAMPLLQLLPTD